MPDDRDDTDVLVEFMRLRGEVQAAIQLNTQAIAANTLATQTLAERHDSTVRVLVWALIGSQLGAETLRVLAEYFLKLGGG